MNSSAQFAAYPGVPGCQAKMLLGLQCGAIPKSSPAELGARAAAFVSGHPSVAYVGLQEHWEHSVCLWHARFGGPLRRIELQDGRPTAAPRGRGQVAGAGEYDEAPLKGFVDVADEALYAAATTRFWKEVGAHAADVEACLDRVRRVDGACRGAAPPPVAR